MLLFNFMGINGKFDHISILIGMVMLALLMVSSVKYYSFKDMNYFLKKPFMSSVFIVGHLIIAIAEPQISILLLPSAMLFPARSVTIMKIITRKKTEKRKPAPKRARLNMPAKGLNYTGS